MKCCKKFFAMSAIVFCTFLPSGALAESISASISAELKIEIKTDSESYSENKSTTYSGIIVDCRGLELQRAASPVIKAESGKIIYGDKDLDFDKINEIGMAAYATSIQESTERAGKNPLIVRAVGVDNFKSNPVIGNSDAEKVLIADSTSNFFKDLKVVFLTE